MSRGSGKRSSRLVDHCGEVVPDAPPVDPNHGPSDGSQQRIALLVQRALDGIFGVLSTIDLDDKAVRWPREIWFVTDQSGRTNYIDQRTRQSSAPPRFHERVFRSTARPGAPAQPKRQRFTRDRYTGKTAGFVEVRTHLVQREQPFVDSHSEHGGNLVR